MHPIIWLRRIARILALIGMFLIACVLALLLLSKPYASGGNNRREERVISWWLGQVGRVFGIRVSAHGTPSQHAVLYVSNHISWLDICVLGGRTRASFLSKSEVAAWPLIGWLASRARTLFIARGKKGASEQALEQLIFRLRGGGQVILFPEATTSDGTSIRRFHPRLLAAALLAKTPVQPVALSYPYEGPGRPPAPFIGEDTLVEHAWRILGEKCTVAVVHFLPLIHPETLDRRALAETARTAIVSQLELSGPATSGRGFSS